MKTKKEILEEINQQTDLECVKEILNLAENFQGQKIIMKQNELFKGGN